MKIFNHLAGGTVKGILGVLYAKQVQHFPVISCIYKGSNEFHEGKPKSILST